MTTTITEFDSKAFRRALGNFATGITVITATTPNGIRAGMTANSFNSVSLEPPLILWSIGKNSGSCAVFEQASHFAVNVLAADQIEVSNHFARPSEDKFAEVNYSEGLGKAPILPDTSACFQCKRHQIIDGGDHWIMIGKVMAFEDAGRAPLIYHQGSYSVVMPHARFLDYGSQATNSEATERLRNRLNDNLYYLMQQAVRAYQADYAPLQLSTGLRTSEARMLIVLQETPSLKDADLRREVNMPEAEVNNATEILQRKGLIQRTHNGYSITASGREQAETLWQLSRQEQEKMFADFKQEDIDTFKKVLLSLINR